MNATNNNATPKALSEQGVLLDLSFHVWGVTRKVREGAVDVTETVTQQEVSTQALRVTKRLLASDEYDAIMASDGECRRRIAELALPYVKRGFYFVPFGILDKVIAILRQREELRPNQVELFVQKYRAHVEQAKVDLGPLWRADDYPSEGYVRECFRVQWSLLELGVPNALARISSELYAAEKAKAQESWRDAADQIRDAMRETFVGLVASLRERLDGERDGGKAKIFRDSRVASLVEWLDLFTVKNVTSDEDLAKVAQQAKDLLSGLTADTLRKRSDLRSEVASGLKAIEDGCRSMGIADAPRRKFRLDD